MKTEQTIASLNLSTEHPTTFELKQLFSWVVWQFPQRTESGYCGAVRPPIPNASWFPACIDTKKERVTIHAHLDSKFNSPELAADYLKS